MNITERSLLKVSGHPKEGRKSYRKKEPKSVQCIKLNLNDEVDVWHPEVATVHPRGNNE